MKFLKHVIIAGTLAFATSNMASAAPILNISSLDFTLLGASGVNVDGTLYDVTFADGFLDASGITAFTTEFGAALASQALLDQVLLGPYDDLSFNTRGCMSTTVCISLTPYLDVNMLVISGAAYNYSGFFGVSDSLEIPYGPYIPDDLSKYNQITLARWTLSTPVPEPETSAMMFAGLGLLGFVARRRKQKAAV